MRVILPGIGHEGHVHHVDGVRNHDAVGGLRGFLRGRQAIHVQAAADDPGVNFQPAKQIRVMQADLPGTRAAHGKTGEDDTVRVNIVALAHGGDGFEDIRFSSPAEGVVAPPEDVHADVVIIAASAPRLVVTSGPIPAQIGDIMAHAVEINIERRWVWPDHRKPGSSIHKAGRCHPPPNDRLV